MTFDVRFPSAGCTWELRAMVCFMQEPRFGYLSSLVTKAARWRQAACPSGAGIGAPCTDWM